MIFAYVAVFCRCVIGIVFVASLVGKLRDIRTFIETISQFRILPKTLHRTAAYGFLLAELIVAICMIIGGILLLPGFILAIVLLLSFSIALVSVLHRRINTSCNCFGATTNAVSLYDVWRNTAFIISAIAGCIALTNTIQTSVAVTESVLLALVAALFVVIWLYFGEVAQLLRQTR